MFFFLVFWGSLDHALKVASLAEFLLCGACLLEVPF